MTDEFKGAVDLDPVAMFIKHVHDDIVGPFMKQVIAVAQQESPNQPVHIDVASVATDIYINAMVSFVDISIIAAAEKREGEDGPAREQLKVWIDICNQIQMRSKLSSPGFPGPTLLN
tara:strand:- start:26762 stop:27112 length:351 start_codon:yes stop_codon:yes gene_type:complete